MRIRIHPDPLCRIRIHIKKRRYGSKWLRHFIFQNITFKKKDSGIFWFMWLEKPQKCWKSGLKTYKQNFLPRGRVHPFPWAPSLAVRDGKNKKQTNIEGYSNSTNSLKKIPFLLSALIFEAVLRNFKALLYFHCLNMKITTIRLIMKLIARKEDVEKKISKVSRCVSIFCFNDLNVIFLEIVLFCTFQTLSISFFLFRENRQLRLSITKLATGQIPTELQQNLLSLLDLSFSAAIVLTVGILFIES